MTKKNRTWLFALAGVASLSVVTLFSVATFQGSRIGFLSNADLEYSMILDRDTELLSQDHGFYHAATVKGSEFDFLGYSPVEGKLGNIKKKNYNGVYDYNGIVYNRSLINGFKTLTVTFTGAKLYYALTSFLMEDMTFDKANEVVSGTPIEAQAGDAYFILYTDDADTGVTIKDLVLTYRCNGDIDATMIFDKTSDLAYARSVPTATTMTESYFVQTNKPTATTNNYSVGGNGSHDYTWYRWNGRAWRNSSKLDWNFEINVTVLGNISQAVNYYENPEDNYFNYSVWPEIHVTDESDYNWAQIYFGNDNYEPLGKDDPDRVHKDAYANYSFAGRFITGYVNYGDDENENWQFADPDTFKTVGDTMTLREAYNAFTLPYWHVKYAFTTVGATTTLDTYVNGIHIFSEEFLNYAEGEQVYIKTLHCHNVNYGKADGSPAASYDGLFTYPRLG